MMKTWQKYALLLGAVSLLGLMIFLILNPPVNQKTQKEKVVKSIESQIGAEIDGDGFVVTYDSGLDLITVTIDKNPYDQYKQAAANYLKSQYKIDICKQNYEFIPSADIATSGSNVNDLASCGK